MSSRILLACLLIIPFHAPAAPLDATSSAQAAITAALQAANQSGTPALSAHRRFPDCSAPPLVRPYKGAWTTVQLSCTTPKWQRLVRIDGLPTPPIPTRELAKTAPTGAQWALTQSLPRGTVLTEAHLTSTSAPNTAGALLQPHEAIGRTLKSNLGAGQVLLARHLEHAWLITEGAAITLSARHSGIIIETRGLALEHGQLGQIIRVQNPSSGRTMSGTVTAPNKVTLLPNIK